jgi:hypothetical protein
MPEPAELLRLRAADEGRTDWKKWGPYLSERQWGTVREDFSASGEAWDYFVHNQANSRAYQAGEDGIAGISDADQQLCFAVAMWNGNDPVIKERLFGLTNREGNHGEDVKEYYFYLDNTPTHSYMKYLYKYPQGAFPYANLERTNERRTRTEPEYELLDSGVFDENRYFDVFVEYAKADVEDILVQITVYNRGPESARLFLMPTLWFRNTWSTSPDSLRPTLTEVGGPGFSGIAAAHWNLGEYLLFCEQHPELLFTENETNTEFLFQLPNSAPFVKDAFHNYVVRDAASAVNPNRTGSKACALYRMTLQSNNPVRIRLRLAHTDARLSETPTRPFGSDFNKTLVARHKEADEFYDTLFPSTIGEEERLVARQALAGLLWNKQYYYFDRHHWVQPHGSGRNASLISPDRYDEWSYTLNGQIISAPDKWEYPWYSSWHVPFHAVAFSLIDRKFAKAQLELLLSPENQSPTGQLPASELNFGEVTPPVHAWAALFLYNVEKFNTGVGDVDFLKRVFLKLLANFTWWLNRRDRFGRNVFEGGFIGLDNIGPFDRNKPLPTGGYIEQADGTAWAAFFCQSMLEIAIELATEDPSYEDMALKFGEHLIWMGSSLNRPGGEGFWDEKDGFYYDRLRFPDGTATRLKVRSLIGLLPLCATTILEKHQLDRCSRLTLHMQRRIRQFPALADAIHPGSAGILGVADRGLVALVGTNRLIQILARLLDENEFLSRYGIRSLSRYHRQNPYTFSLHGDKYSVSYLAGESDSSKFDGNTNWCGPLWLPMNVMIIRALLGFYAYYGDTLKVACPTGSNNVVNLFEVSQELARRLTTIFLADGNGRRPVYGNSEKFQTDAHWRNYMMFFEYFNGDTGTGLGANHMTGWTALIAGLIHMFSYLDAESLLAVGKEAAFRFPTPRKAG